MCNRWLAPLCLNLRINGLMTPSGFYALHEPYQFTLEDYLNGRVIEEPLVIYDCERLVNTCAAFIFTIAERAEDLREKPVYILDHAQRNSRGRSSMSTLDEHQEAVASMVRKMREGSGLGPDDADSIQQLRGTAGARQVTVRAETALAGCNTPDSNGFIMFGKYPS